MSSLIVFNLPKTVTKNDLSETFGQKWNVTNIQLIFTDNNEYCYFALITYGNEKDAKAAHNHFDKAHLFSSRLMVERCNEIENNKAQDENVKQKTEINNLKLGKIAESTSPPQSSSNYLAYLPYEEGQWSANNPTGKKVYSKSFLIQLGNQPVCQKKHENLNFKDSFVKSTSFMFKVEKKEKKRKGTKSSTCSLVSPETVQDFNGKPMNELCEHFIQVNEEVHSLRENSFKVMIDSLVKDTKSIFYNNHEKFVTSMSLATLNCSCSREQIGKLFADLLSAGTISITALTKGIHGTFKDWYHYLDTYPEFFSQMADIISPLLISVDVFEFSHLKDVCKSLNSNTASAVLFFEVLKKILYSQEVQQQGNGIVWIYKKWKKSEVTLDSFVLNNQINKYFTNDRLGVFMLSMAMYDKIRIADCNTFNDIMTNWIKATIKQEIIQYPQFIRALAIAVCFAGILKTNKSERSSKNLFDCLLLKFLSSNIHFNENAPFDGVELLRREVECLNGIQLAWAVINYDGVALKPAFCLLYKKVIREDSFSKWKNESKFNYGFHEDLQIKAKAKLSLHDFFDLIYCFDGNK